MLPDIIRDLLRRLVTEVAHGARLLRVSDTGEQVGDLVGVHARGGHLDRASPVEVVMTQVEGQLLNLELGEGRLVQGNEEVRGTHASLSASDRNEEEIEFFVRLLRLLNQVAVDDAAAGWVAEAVVAVENEERLNNPLVDDQKSDLGAGGRLVVDLVEGGLELDDFTINDLGALSSTHTISENDDVRRVAVVVFGTEHVDG